MFIHSTPLRRNWNIKLNENRKDGWMQKGMSMQVWLISCYDEIFLLYRSSSLSMKDFNSNLYIVNVYGNKIFHRLMLLKYVHFFSIQHWNIIRGRKEIVRKRMRVKTKHKEKLNLSPLYSFIFRKLLYRNSFSRWYTYLRFV